MSEKIYEMVTNQIIEKLEAGVAPWQKPWKASGGPRNFVTGRRYSGINVFLLLAQGFGSPYWMTYKQAAKAGGHVREGEKSTIVVFWKQFEVERETEDGETVTRKIPMLRYYRLFNLDQIDGLEAPAEEEPSEFVENLRAKDIVHGYADSPKINETGDSAFYSPVRDQITVPPRHSFSSEEAFYSTLFHEMGHSTGHESRLNRHTADDLSGVFGSHGYGREELVAEMTAAFLTAEAGLIPATHDNSAAYLQSWIDTIREDTKAVVWAAGRAQKASDYILGR